MPNSRSGSLDRAAMLANITPIQVLDALAQAWYRIYSSLAGQWLAVWLDGTGWRQLDNRNSEPIVTIAVDMIASCYICALLDGGLQL